MTDSLNENQKPLEEQIPEEKPELATEVIRPSDDFEDESRVVAADEGASESLTSFAEAPLTDSLRQAIAELGWKQPTPVQGMCLPLTLIGRDVAGFAQTGTGKTGVFLISTAQRILEHRATGGGSPTAGGAAHPLALVLAPTRELAMQIEQDAQNLFGRLGISSIAVFGGIDYDKQAKRLKEGVDVIIATPGRLKDYFEKKLIRLEQCKIFVCDEADRMFDMGFIEDVEFFLGKLPEDVQKLLFSATTNDEVKELAFEYLDKPAYISVNPETLTPENIEQHAIIVDAPNKLKVMLGMLREHKPTCCIIFTNTKLTAEWLHYKLSHNGVDVDLITGDLPQRKRIQLIHKIKEGKVKALIATDVASRGLHISRITHVYNFDLPQEPANYVHRIGRTARAGAKGSSFSLICDDYGENFAPIKDLLGEQFPVKSKWYDTAYDSVVDEAGNPFEERIRAWKEMKASRSSAGRSGATRHGDRGPRRDGRPGGERPQHARRDGQQPRRHEGQQMRHDGQQRPQRHDHQHRDRNRGGERRHDRHGEPRHERHHERDHNRGRDRGHHQGAPMRHDQPQVAAQKPQDNSVVGLVKKMFRVLFGG
ncbi:DEAD/DEAH box helicase [bacterium]|nr:DEAD/DEAH box helicase [bacterium]